MDNYLNLCNGAKWPLRLMPISVYIGYYHLYDIVASSNVMACQDAVCSAFGEWQRITQNKIAFNILKNGGNNLYSSQINVIFRKNSNDIKGKTSLDIDNKKQIFGAEIEIDLPANYISIDKLYFVALCEIGKSLGLANSDVPEDVTYYPYRFVTKTPSQRDINTINLLYDITKTSTHSPNVQTTVSQRNMLNELDNIAELKMNLFNINFKNKK
ncbi:hypothetical protein IKQ21_05340 [bacterium]|nr:hypothetical protein [bacterium]